MMELEVSKKVREAIKAKLIEIGSHVDDELPDYIMILIANRRSNQEIEGDLCLFLAENTKKFVGWLTHVLKKLEQVTTSEAVASAVSKAMVLDAVLGEEPETDENNIQLENSIEIEKTESGLEMGEVEEEVQQQVQCQPSTVDIKEVVQVQKSPEKVKQRTISIAKIQKPVVKKVAIKRNDPKKSEVEKKETIKIKNGNTVAVQDNHLEVAEKVPAIAPTPTNIEDLHNDTLILDTGENEFSTDNLDELRRIALESREKKRKDIANSAKVVHPRKLITNILMSRANDGKDSSGSAVKPSRPWITSRTERIVPRSTENTSESSSSRHPINSSSRDRSHARTSSRTERSTRVLRSPRRQEHRRSSERRVDSNDKANNNRRQERSPASASVFSRIGSSSSRRSTTRSRSRSPVRKMSSKIGHVVVRRSPSPSSGEDVSPVRSSVSSVIKVAERPKRDLHLNNKMLLRAVADAQQSIIQTEQNSQVKVMLSSADTVKLDASDVRKHTLKRTSGESVKDSDVIAKRKFYEFPEVDTKDFYEPTDAATRRKSVKERLGVKRETRRPVKERLGAMESFPNSPGLDMYEEERFSPGCNYKIYVNVGENESSSSVNGKQRNVMLAANDSKRISIQVNNNSEEDDTSDASTVSDGTKKRVVIRNKIRNKDSTRATKDKDALSDVEFQLVISDEDKLPEVPKEVSYAEDESEHSEYEYEEIVEEEDDINNNDGETTGEIQDMSQTNMVEFPQEPNFSITINKLSALSVRAAQSSNLPDLRTIMNKPTSSAALSSSPTSAAAANGTVKCKFWPSCQFKDKCIYEHPKCKFTPCKNKDCVYKHEIVATTSPKSSAKVVCKWYPKCTSMNCKFHHPSPCRFGMGCTDARCESYHPGVTLGMKKLKAKGFKLLPKANELKWIKK